MDCLHCKMIFGVMIEKECLYIVIHAMHMNIQVCMRVYLLGLYIDAFLSMYII